MYVRFMYSPCIQRDGGGQGRVRGPEQGCGEEGDSQLRERRQCGGFCLSESSLVANELLSIREMMWSVTCREILHHFIMSPFSLCCRSIAVAVKTRGEYMWQYSTRQLYALDRS